MFRLFLILLLFATSVSAAGFNNIISYYNAASATYAFSDDFSVDSISTYTLTDTWGSGGAFLYDSTGERGQITTGASTALQVSHSIDSATSGSFSIDVKPTARYNTWGLIKITLYEDDNNYYELCNSDNSAGPCNGISKVVGGSTVDTESFTGYYVQGTDYSITITFTPGQTVVTAFGDVLTINTNTSGITVGSFRIELAQQDTYIDNILYSD